MADLIIAIDEDGKGYITKSRHCRTDSIPFNVKIVDHAYYVSDNGNIDDLKKKLALYQLKTI